ncbi:MAG TPA: tetratricopeptide repeat protein [Chryseolinea sp.]|nr:tetratricopeptide repeat protein [Chryseolinea sp.]
MKNSIMAGVVLLAILFTSTASFAQCKEVVWPTDPAQKAKAEESKVLYEDAKNAKQYKQALVPLNWLLANVPNFHSSLYINGADIYDELAEAEKDPARKKIYVDSLMIVYDLRMKNCGDDPSVFNRKALLFLKYNSADQPAETLKMLDEVFQKSGNNVMDATLVPYFQVVRLNAAKFKKMTDVEILERYDKLMAIIDAKIQKTQSEGKPVDKYKKYKDDIDAMLITMVKVDCDFVRANLAPKFKQNPNDIALAKKIFSFMLQGKCTDDPLWLQAAETVHKDPNGTKDCGLAKNLGIIYMSKDELDKAEAFLKEAQGICTEGQDKAEVLLYLGTLTSKKGNKAGARELYRQAAAANATVAKEAYEKIGDLYFNSAGECGKKVNQADDRLVFLLAADYYQRAGNGQKVAQAKSAFPSKEDIFLVNYQPGDSKKVECWINETTTIRTRD